MKLMQKIFIFSCILFTSTPFLAASCGLLSDAGFNTWVDIKNTCAAIATKAISIAKDHPAATKMLLTGTVVAAGITCIVIPAIAAGYLGHRWYMKYQLYKAELALKEQARLLFLRNAKT